MGTEEPLVWSRRRLRAAYWVVRVLGSDGERQDVARASWTALPLAGEIDLDDLRSAEDGLRATGLLRLEGERLVPDRRLCGICAEPEPAPLDALLALILETSPPLWLLTATADPSRLAVELLPGQISAGLETVIEDPARREAFLLARARTVDAQERSELGEAGEEAVVRACRAQLRAAGSDRAARGVRRVSLVSDELGYDVVAPRLDDSVRRLEVKATRADSAEVIVAITRNELETGLADPDWHLVLARVARDGESSVLGHLPAASLQPLLPEDRSGTGRWQVARLRLLVADLIPGLPAVLPPDRPVRSGP